MWVFPAAGIVAALGTAWSLHSLELVMGWQSYVDPAAAQTLLATLAASMFTFIVFACSSLLITVQLASAQLTPRVVGMVLEHRDAKIALAVFTFTFTFTLASLVRIEGAVPLVTTHAAAYSCLLSMCLFLYLLDKVCAVLRPSGALSLTARTAHGVIEKVFPRRLSESPVPAPELPTMLNAEPRCVLPVLREGVVLAFDMPGLVAIAQRADCVIEMVPQVGDFVAAEEPLFRVFGDGEMPPASVLYESVAVGPERTLQQDPAFGFRIMVDIASKGLSPAINDPTTAVLAVDQIQYLLRHVGKRYLDEGRVRDAQGAVRLLYRTPDWEDFVHLAVTEIRLFGGTSIQVMRRLRAMLESLIQVLPEERIAALRMQLSLLDRSAARFFGEAEDLAMAVISDTQGVGGKRALNGERGSNRPRTQYP